MKLFGSYKTKHQINNAYQKAVWVIESCKSQDHITGAKHYANNFFEFFSEPTGERVYGMNTYYSSPLIETYYIRLQRRIKEKEQSLLASTGSSI